MYCSARPDVLFVAPFTGSDPPADAPLQFAPLGILTLAAVLESHGFTVGLLEIDLERAGRDEFNFTSRVGQKIAQSGARVVGMGSICNSYPLTLRIAERVKQINPEIFLILGGPQASVSDQATLVAFPCIDVVVRGEGEQIVPSLLDLYLEGRPFDHLQGITFRDHAQLVRKPNAPPVLDLDGLPIPAFHLLKHDGPSRAAAIELGRGCPFACNFCSTNDFFRRRFRLKSPEVVLKQMYFLADRYGTQSFELVHDMFTVDRRAVIRFCDSMRKANTGFRWSCSARTDCVDEELLEYMALAGCDGIFFGIETGSQSLQKAVNKNLDIREAKAVIRAAVSRRISITASLITGFPEETPDDFRETVGFLAEVCRFDEVSPQLHLLSPLTATPLEIDYHSRLVLDQFISDISRGGTGDASDWDLIARYPEIFSSFYSLPLAHLKRTDLVIARLFLLNSLTRMRWLMVALHIVAGHLLEVINSWRRRWPERTDAEYLRSAQFDLDLLEFAEAQYPSVQPISNLYRLIQRMANAPIRTDNVITDIAGISGSSVPILHRNIRAINVDFDVTEILTALRDGHIVQPESGTSLGFLIRRRDDGSWEILRSTRILTKLLLLADGSRTISEIAGQLDWDPGILSAVSSEDATILSAKRLQEHEMLAFI